MLRLGVVGGSAEWRAGKIALHGANFEPAAPPVMCDAVIVVEATGDTVDALLAANKHVLLLDLAGLNRERIDAWSAQVRSGQQFGIVNRDRYLPSRQLIRQQIERNLGTPGLIRLHRWAATLSEPPLLSDLDLVTWLMGQMPNVVYASKADGLLHAHLGFPGGGMALLSHAAGPHLAAGYTSLSVIASSGAAHAEDHANRQLHFTDAGVQALPTGEQVALTPLAQSFVDAIEAKADVRAGLDAWMRILDLGHLLEDR